MVEISSKTHSIHKGDTVMEKKEFRRNIYGNPFVKNSIYEPSCHAEMGLAEGSQRIWGEDRQIDLHIAEDKKVTTPHISKEEYEKYLQEL